MFFPLFLAIFLFPSDAFSQEDSDPRRIDPITGLVALESEIEPKKHRWSLVFHTPHNLADTGRLLGIEGLYAYRWGKLWPEFSFRRITAQTEKVSWPAFDGSGAGNALDDQIGIAIFGAGLSLPSTWVQELTDEKGLYTTSAASLNYVVMSDGTSSNNFAGLGLTADFGLHYRAGESWHYGLKTGYHLSKVRRMPLFDGEPSALRSQYLSFLSLGFDLSLYF